MLVIGTIHPAIALLQLFGTVHRTNIRVCANLIALFELKYTQIMPSESQHTINERLKFLIDRSGLSIRKFSSMLGVSDTNTRNYLDRGSKLNSEYIEKVLRQFSDINPTWFILGDGEPFLGDTPNTSIDINAKKNKGNVLSSNSGSNTINHNHITLEDCKRDLETSRKEAEMLREQIKTKDALLDSKDALIAAKEEMLTLLRGGHNRPN